MTFPAQLPSLLTVAGRVDWWKSGEKFLVLLSSPFRPMTVSMSDATLTSLVFIYISSSLWTMKIFFGQIHRPNQNDKVGE